MVVCSSGTAALHLALEAMGLPAGSEVLVPDYTMVACARAVTLAGLTPVFVDCNERLLMSHIELGKIGDRVDAGDPAYDKLKAVMFVHIYGRRQDVDGLMEDDDIKNPGAIRIIEDLAEAHGVKPSPLTDAACWSFYKNKIIAGEEGGAVAFKDVAHAEAARELRSLGFTKEHNFVHRPRGHNYRLANCLAEKVLEGLEDAFGGGGPHHQAVYHRRVAETRYDEACPAEWKMPPRDAPWVYDIRVPGLRRTKMVWVVRALNEAGIQARMGFCPMTLQPEYIKANGYKVSGMNAARAFDEVFYLPLTPGVVTRESVEVAFDVIRKCLES
jgi:dTDP-4-amino-4,6-dideoxygalactose transaminase